MKKSMFFLLLLIIPINISVAEEEVEMSLNQIQNINQICAGGLIAVESSLLLFGMNYPAVTDWSSVKNISFALSDIVLGSSLIFYSLSEKTLPPSILYLTYGLLLSTHIYRSFEIVPILSENKFCHNTPLYILNNIRIGLLATGLGLTVRINY